MESTARENSGPPICALDKAASAPPNGRGARGSPEKHGTPDHSTVVRPTKPELLLFYQVVCTVDFNFWRAVGYRKLGEWKLETPCIPLKAALVPLESSRSLDAGSSSAASGSLGWRLHLDKNSLGAIASPSELGSNRASSVGQAPGQGAMSSSLEVRGVFCNVNSMDDFKKMNRAAFVDEVLRRTVRDLISAQTCLRRAEVDVIALLKANALISDDRVPSLLHCRSADDNLLSIMSPFLLLSYADLKNHLYHYNVALPTLRPAQDFRIIGRTLLGAQSGAAASSQLLPPSLISQIGKALFRSPLGGTRVAGLSGVCVMLRRSRIAELPPVEDHWLDQLYDASSVYVTNTGSPSDNNAYAVVLLSADVILLPLCLLLFHLHSCRASNSVSAQAAGNGKSQSSTQPLLQSQRTSGIICFIDSVRGDGTAFGWPSRSALYALGALGLTGGILTLFAYRDGVSGTIRQDTSSRPETDGRSNSIIFDVIMPTADHFDLSSFTAIEAGESAIKATDVVSDRPDDACGSPPLSPQPDLACALAQDDPSNLRRQRLRSDSNLEGGQRASSLLSPALSYSCRSARESAVAGWHRRVFSAEQADQRETTSSATEGGSHRTLTTSITFVVDLKRHLDPIVSQSDAVDLNLRLIKWRILPSLDLTRLQGLRFLVFGVGTLGCHVLRNLVGWGFREFTLVDCGKVALSSPVRQCLYMYEDAVWGQGQGRSKVAAAKKRLLQIRPGLLINALDLEIPMPGHPRFLINRGAKRSTNEENTAPNTESKEITSATRDMAEDDLQCRIRLLERLVDAHDVVLLLTDSRESRWLPSMLVSSRQDEVGVLKLKPPPVHPRGEDVALQGEDVGETLSNSGAGCVQTPTSRQDMAEGAVERLNMDSEASSALALWDRLFTTPTTYKTPLCLSVAIGFDSFVVIRHGQRPSTKKDGMPAVVEATKEEDATLACYFCNDLSAPADSTLQRPLDEQCTVTRPGISGLAASIATELLLSVMQHPSAPHCSHDARDYGAESRQHSCLGSVPHTIRGALGKFELVAIGTSAFKHCIACSVPVSERYCSSEKDLFVSEVIARSEILEEVSGLAAMKQCQRENEVTVLPLEEDTPKQETSQ